jgi:type I restriction enzyme S subunit
MTYKTTTLDTFVTLQRGFDLPSQDRIPGDIPIIAANGPVGFHNIAKVKGQSVVLGRSGSVGNPQLITGAFWPLNTTLFVKDFHGNSPTFVYYVLKTIDFKSFDAGGTVPTLNRNHLTQIEVPLLDLAHQESIGGVLRNLDLKIAANNALSRTLEEIAQTIFKSWFIDFDPVKAKMAGEKPVGMDDTTAALFPDSLEETELGFIPKGWEIRKIESLCETLLGGTPSRTRDEFWGGEIPWINSGKVNDFRITAASEYITEIGLEKSATKLLPRGTTVLAITGATLGQFSRLEIDSCANQSVVGIVASAEASNEFIYFNIKNGIQRLISAQTGGAQQHINKEDVNAFFIIYPGKKLMDAFTDVVRSMFDEIGVLLNQSISLATIRDSLLPRLISGELEIPEDMLVS